MIFNDRNFLCDEPFDVAEVRLLLGVAERVCGTTVSSPACSPDAMHVSFRDVRQIDVDYIFEFVNVDASRGDVGGDQHSRLPRFEVAKCALAGVLGLVAVNRLGGDIVFREKTGHLVRSVLGSREDQSAFDFTLLKQVREQAVLVFAVNKQNLLVDDLNGR